MARPEPSSGASSEKNEIRLADGPNDTISAVRFSPSISNGRLLMVSSWDGTVRIHDTDNNTKRHQFEIGEPVLDCCFSVTTRSLLAYSRLMDFLQLYTCIIFRMPHMHSVVDWIIISRCVISTTASISLLATTTTLSVVSTSTPLVTLWLLAAGTKLSRHGIHAQNLS